MKPTSRAPTPMSPAGTSVSDPMWRNSSLTNAWQKRMTSPGLRPLGSKSEPPLPPPIGSVVSAFLKVCSKARNLRIDRLTRRMEAQAALVGPDRGAVLDAVAAVDLDVAVIVHPGNAELHDALGFDQPVEQTVLRILRVLRDPRPQALHHLGDGLQVLGLAGIAVRRHDPGMLREMHTSSTGVSLSGATALPRGGFCNKKRPASAGFASLQEGMK